MVDSNCGCGPPTALLDPIQRSSWLHDFFVYPALERSQKRSMGELLALLPSPYAKGAEIISMAPDMLREEGTIAFIHKQRCAARD